MPQHLLTLAALCALSCAVLPGCQEEGEICPNDDPTLHTGRTPTSLKDDCRCVVSSNVNYLPGCLKITFAVDKQKQLGEGPSFYHMGVNVRVYHGDLWQDRGEIIAAVSNGSNKPGFIMGLDYKTGARRIISGWYDDPMLGPQTVAEGPEWGQPTYALRGPDDMIYVLTKGHRFKDPDYDSEKTYTRIWRVDPDSGQRTLVWHSHEPEFGQCKNGGIVDTLGNPTEEQPPQVVGGLKAFEVTKDGSFIMGTLGGGIWPSGDGVIEVSPDGKSCRTITMNPGHKKNKYPEGIGGGPKFISGVTSINEIDDVLYVMDGKGLFEVDRESGFRKRLSSELPPGMLELDKKRNVFHVTATHPPFANYYYVANVSDLDSFKSGGCIQPDPDHPYAQMCIGIASGNAYSGGPNNQGWLLPDGEHMIKVNELSTFVKIDLDTGVSNHFSY